jgi:hypothetical protein
MRIWKEVTGSFHEKFEVICGLEQMIEDDVMAEFVLLSRLEEIWKNALITSFEVLGGLEYWDREIQEQFDILCGLVQIWLNVVMT